MRTGMREAGRRGPAVVAAVAPAMALAGSAVPATASERRGTHAIRGFEDMFGFLALRQRLQ